MRSPINCLVLGPLPQQGRKQEPPRGTTLPSTSVYFGNLLHSQNTNYLAFSRVYAWITYNWFQISGPKILFVSFTSVTEVAGFITYFTAVSLLSFQTSTLTRTSSRPTPFTVQQKDLYTCHVTPLCSQVWCPKITMRNQRSPAQLIYTPTYQVHVPLHTPVTLTHHLDTEKISIEKQLFHKWRMQSLTNFIGFIHLFYLSLLFYTIPKALLSQE